MGFNLVDLVKDQLTDQVTGYIGNMIGGDTHKTKSLLDGAVPAILGGLMHTSSTKEGAGALFDVVKKQDDSILDNIGDLLGGNKADSLIKMGSSALGSLLGGSGGSGGMLGNIIDAVSGHSGIEKKHTTSVMGFLAPIIFGVIKRKLLGGGESSFNVGSLVDMFKGQKDNITATLPKGLNLNFDNNFAETVSQTTHQAANEGKSLLSRLLPLILLLVAAWLVYTLFFSSSNTVKPAKQTTEQMSTANLGQNVGASLTSIVNSLKGIKDVATAKSAVSGLTEATNKLGMYAGSLGKLSSEAKAPVVNLVAEKMPMLKELLNKVSMIPGVGEIIKPIVEKLGANLSLFK